MKLLHKVENIYWGHAVVAAYYQMAHVALYQLSTVFAVGCQVNGCRVKNPWLADGGEPTKAISDKHLELYMLQ